MKPATVAELELEAEKARADYEAETVGKFEHESERQQWINDRMAIRFGAQFSRLFAEVAAPPTALAVRSIAPLEVVPDTLPTMQRAVLNAIDALWGGITKIPPMTRKSQLKQINDWVQANGGGDTVSYKTVMRALEAAAPANPGQ
jgi:hypothetical protein